MELFLHQVRRQKGVVYVNDIVDLIEEDRDNYPLKKILTDMDTFTDKSWEFKRESLLQRIDIHSRKVEALKYHDLFK